MDKNIFSVDLIREVFHYQSRFNGSTMVFKIDYPVTESPGFPGLVKDLALLAQTGFKVIIVPGAKENIDSVLKQHNIETKMMPSPDSAYNSGSFQRITSQQAIPFVKMAAFDVAGKFMTFLSGCKVEAVIGNFVRARGLGIINGIDTGHTGTVDKIYANSLGRVLDLGMVPIIPCIGLSPSGKPYNVSSDEIALAVSSAMGAAKLFILSAHGAFRLEQLNLQPGVPKKSSLLRRLLNGQNSLMKHSQKFLLQNITENLETRDDGSLIKLTPQQALSLITAYNETSSDWHFIRELKLALQASRAGIHRVHIINGMEEGVILKELFSNLGAGVMIHIDEYDSIRALRSSDLPDILRLMEPLMQKGILVRRNAEQIQEKKDDYAVLEIDGSIRACGALHDWGESKGEIAAVATDPQYTRHGLGKQIVGYLIEKARKANLRQVFLLTTQTQDWFESLGFTEAALEILPKQKRKVYDQSRKSKIFALELQR